jgi:hypothetical protein
MKIVKTKVYGYQVSGDTGPKGVAVNSSLSGWVWDGRYNTYNICEGGSNITDYMGDYTVSDYQYDDNAWHNSKILIYEGYIIIDEDRYLCKINEIRAFEPHNSLVCGRNAGVIFEFYDNGDNLITTYNYGAGQVRAGWCWYKLSENQDIYLPESNYNLLPEAKVINVIPYPELDESITNSYTSYMTKLLNRLQIKEYPLLGSEKELRYPLYVITNLEHISSKITAYKNSDVGIKYPIKVEGNDLVIDISDENIEELEDIGINISVGYFEDGLAW